MEYFGKSQKSVEETNKQTATEKINLKITNIQMATYTKKQQMPNLQELADGLCNDEADEIEYVIVKEKSTASLLPYVDTKGHDSIFTKLREYPYEFEIDSSLRLASINGVKVADTSNDELKGKITNLETAVKTLQDDKIILQNRIQKLENKRKPVLIERNMAKSTKAVVKGTWTDLETISLSTYGKGKGIVTCGFQVEETVANATINIVVGEKYCSDGERVQPAHSWTTGSASMGFSYDENTRILLKANISENVKPFYQYSILLIPDE